MSKGKARDHLQCHTLLLAHLFSPNILPLGVCEVKGGKRHVGRSGKDGISWIPKMWLCAQCYAKQQVSVKQVRIGAVDSGVRLF